MMNMIAVYMLSGTMLSALIAAARDRSVILWAAFGILAGPIAVAIVMWLPSRRPAPVSPYPPHAMRSLADEIEALDDQRQRGMIQAGPLLSVEHRGKLGIIRINNSLGDQALVGQFAQALATLADTTTLLIDLRATPSGGNTSVARGIMGHFVDHDMPYQMHVIPYETRVLGPTRRFVEYVAPYGTRYTGKVYVAGGRWTGSMGEGLMIGFDAIGATTIGSELAHLLGGLSNETIDGSAAKVDLGTEQLFTVAGLPRAAYRPQLYVANVERDGTRDPAVNVITR